MLDFMVNHPFFFFCDLVFMDYCFNFGWYSQKCWQKNLKLWWYSWNAKKKIETTWCLGWARGHIFAPAAQRLRPRALRALPRLPRCAADAKNALGPTLGTRWFQFILFLHSMKPPKFQIFCQHFCETTQNSNNYPWNQVTKKNEWFPIKTFFFIRFQSPILGQKWLKMRF